MRRIIIGLVALLALAACQGSIEFNIEDDYTELTITFTEEEVAEVMSGILTSGIPPLLEDPTVNLRSGDIAISGQHSAWNGESYPVELVFTMWAEDGGVRSAVTDFDFNGAPISDERIERLNQALADGFTPPASDETQVVDVDITSDELRITTRTPR